MMIGRAGSVVVYAALLGVPLSCSVIQGPFREVSLKVPQGGGNEARDGPRDPVLRALDYLGDEMDIFHTRTVIYDDLESGGERYYGSGWMGVPEPGNTKSLTVSHSWDFPASGVTCLRVEWRPQPSDQWVGVYWQHPEDNWGEDPRLLGLDLSGASCLSFLVRGETGKEVVEFKFGGIPGGARLISSGPMLLSREWSAFEFDLRKADLGNVIGGFCWVALSSHNPDGCVLYLDDIEIDAVRLSEPRLVRSYHVGERRLEEIEVPQLRNISYVYDNAVALCALLSSPRSEDVQRARLIADALVTLSEWEDDQSLCNAYCCGDLMGRDPQKEWELTPRYPWKHNRGDSPEVSPEDHPVLLDAYSLGKDTGNMSWAALALIHCWDVFGDERYLRAARGLAVWIEENCSSSLIGIGFTGGQTWNAMEEKREAVAWQSTEHNIDYAVVCRKLSIALPRESERWRANAEHASEFVRWAAEQDPPRLVTGTIDGEPAAALTPKPLDPQTWAVLAFREEAIRYGEALAWATTNCEVSREGCRGYGFSCLPQERAEKSDIWLEGTAQVALALKSLGLWDRAREVLEQVEVIIERTSPPTAAKGGVVAAYPLVVDTGFDLKVENQDSGDGEKNGDNGLKYHNLRHVGATAWYVLAKRNWNPFWPPIEPRVLRR